MLMKLNAGVYCARVHITLLYFFVSIAEEAKTRRVIIFTRSVMGASALSVAAVAVISFTDNR